MSRRLLQFSLASILIVMTVLSVWLAYRANTKTSRAIANIKNSGGRVEQTEDSDPDKPVIEKLSFQGNSETTNRDILPIRDLKNVNRIDLDYTDVDDISPIRNQINLRWLDLEGTKISSEDLVNLERLDKLIILVLTDTKISNEGLEYIADMTQLLELRLNNTEISDECLVHFKKLKRLREINLRGTKVTRAGIRRLQLDLPNCEIKHDF